MVRPPLAKPLTALKAGDIGLIAYGDLKALVIGVQMEQETNIVLVFPSRPPEPMAKPIRACKLDRRVFDSWPAVLHFGGAEFVVDLTSVEHGHDYKLFNIVLDETGSLIFLPDDDTIFTSSFWVNLTKGEFSPRPNSNSYWIAREWAVVAPAADADKLVRIFEYKG